MTTRLPRGQRVLAELRDLILTGAIAPGEVLVEPQLAERFGTSKTPVREALQALAAQSLVTVLPKKGYLVATMTGDDLAEVLELRMLLEPHAAGECTRHARPDDVARLRAHLDAQRASAADDPISAMEHAARLHREIAGLGRNGRLSAALDACFDQTARAHHVLPGLNAHAGDDVELAEHTAVLDAIACGDGPGARDAMAAHLRTIRRVTLLHGSEPGGLWG